MSETVINIIIGVGASFIASLIWWTLTQLYFVGARNRINFLLASVRDDNYLYQKALEYRDYDLALSQAERMIDKISEIYAQIKPLTYTKSKRILINTLLNNAYSIIRKFKFYYIGHDSVQEKEACCEKAQRHLFSVGYKTDSESSHYPDPHQFQSVTAVTIQLLIDLNLKRKAVVDILADSSCFERQPIYMEDGKKYFLDLIDADNFDGSYSKEIAIEWQVTTKILKKEQYIKLIDTVFSKYKSRIDKFGVQEDEQ